MAVRERGEHDPVHVPEPGVECAQFQRPGGEPYHDESGLLQLAGELAVAHGQGHDFLRTATTSAPPLPLRGRLHKLFAGLEQALDFGFTQGSAIDSHFVQFTLERLSDAHAP